MPSPSERTLRYFFRTMNLIDFLAIAPFYASLAFGTVGLSFLRVGRLAGWLAGRQVSGGRAPTSG